MHELEVTVPFHLDHTLNSGQVFRWQKTKGTWEGIVEKKLIKISHNGSIHCNCDRRFLYTYFRLNDDLDKILSSIDKDQHIHRVISAVRGLRLVRQDPWECLISFICSAFNNVPRIKLIIENLCTKFGEKLEYGYSFPTPEALSKASTTQLRECGVGYRDKYVQTTARIISAGFELSELQTLPYDEAKKILMELPGVGQKVADCVLLFSLDKLEAFPCDVNIEKCVNSFYGPVPSVRVFGQKYFGAYAGYANHYLFCYHRLYR